jgi:hypothetical protein
VSQQQSYRTQSFPEMRQLLGNREADTAYVDSIFREGIGSQAVRRPIVWLTRLIFDSLKGVFRPTSLLPLHRAGVSFRDIIPINRVPKRCDILWPAILVLQVVRVFPNIDTKNWDFFFILLRYRVILVWR